MGSRIRGFGVQVMPSGLKSFVIRYRTPESRPRRVAIGRFGLMTVEEARILAHEKLVAANPPGKICRRLPLMWRKDYVLAACCLPRDITDAIQSPTVKRTNAS